jgi:hypothetical protein
MRLSLRLRDDQAQSRADTRRHWNDPLVSNGTACIKANPSALASAFQAKTAHTLSQSAIFLEDDMIDIDWFTKIEIERVSAACGLRLAYAKPASDLCTEFFGSGKILLRNMTLSVRGNVEQKLRPAPH